LRSLRHRRIAVRVAAALVAVGLVAYAALAPTVRAADQPFTAGQGIAAAYALHIGEAWNGADVGVTLGVVGGQYQNSTAKASSQTLDPGILALISNVRYCNHPSPLPLPAALEANTDDSNGQPISKSTSSGRSGPAVGSQSVKVRPNADGSGDGAALDFDFPGLIAIKGGIQHAEAKVDPVHQVRTVTSEVSVGSLTLLGSLPMGGIQLGGLRWFLQEVVTGADNRTDTRSVISSFSINTAKVFGVALPVANPNQAQGVLTMVNTAAKPFGLQLRLPKLEPDGQFGLAYSPLTVAIGGKTLYGPVVAPLLGGATITQVERALQPGVFDTASCNELAGLLKPYPAVNALWNSLGSAAPLVIGAVAAGIDGQGELDIDLGKVRTSVDDTYYAPPSYPMPNYGAPAGGTGWVPGTPGSPGSAGALAANAPSGGVALGQRNPAGSTGATLANAGHIHCETTSPVGWPGCWKGAAPIAAGVAGVVTLSLLAADEVFRRRRLASVGGSKDA
jgi:hypothetical protein